MKIKISTVLLIIIIIVAIIIGITFLLPPKQIVEIVTERDLNEITNEKIKSELEGRIDADLQEQDEIFEKKLDEYISDIYMGLDTYMSEFDNINLADENWIWKCTYRFLYKDDKIFPASIISKEDIEITAKSGKEIIVNIVEYKYNEIFLAEPTEFNLYKISSDEVIKTYSLNTTILNDNYNDFLLSKHNEARTFVKENSELFSTATITLEYDEQNDLLYIKSFKR